MLLYGGSALLGPVIVKPFQIFKKGKGWWIKSKFILYFF